MNTPKHFVRVARISRGFTLIELLTVIAIIGILAALIIPTVGKVREAARQTACLSNVRAIGRAMQMYANDNRGALPLPQLANQFSAGQAWWFGLDPYFQNAASGNLTRTQQIARCGSDDTPPSAGGITWSYAMNQNLARNTDGTYSAAGTLPVVVNQLRNELNRTVMIAEIGNVPGTARVGALSPAPGTGAGQNSGFERHGGRGNYGFVDGSVKTLRRAETYDTAATPPLDLWSVR